MTTSVCGHTGLVKIKQTLLPAKSLIFLCIWPQRDPEGINIFNKVTLRTYSLPKPFVNLICQSSQEEAESQLPSPVCVPWLYVHPPSKHTYYPRVKDKGAHIIIWTGFYKTSHNMWINNLFSWMVSTNSF